MIYVRAALELLRSDVQVHGLAHITGDGLLNLLRLNPDVGYHIDAPLEPQPVFGLIQRCGERARRGDVGGVQHGHRAVLPWSTAAMRPRRPRSLGKHHPGARVIGEVTDSAGTVRLPSVGLVGDKAGFRRGWPF